MITQHMIAGFIDILPRPGHDIQAAIDFFCGRANDYRRRRKALKSLIG